MKITEEAIISKLSNVLDPELRRSIVDLKMVDEITESNGDIKVKVKLTVPGCPMKNKISGDIDKELKTIDGVKNIDIEFSSMTPDERQNLTKQLSGKKPSDIFQSKQIKNVILVASGKGGVGKSTVSANLAAALAKEGSHTGLLDADIYGFSIPRIMGISGKPTILNEMILPMEAHGVKVMSMGFFMGEAESVIWRGPMIHKAVNQFINDVFWDKLDYLLIDLPPGTGDVALSIAQTVTDASAIIVTTPQTGAYVVASRIARLIDKFKIKKLGVIENMSYYLDNNGNRDYIFGKGGGTELSRSLGIPLLGEIPLESEIRKSGDKGSPIVVSNVESEASIEFRRIAKSILTGQ